MNQLVFPEIRSDKRGKLIEIVRGKFAQCNILIMKKGSVWGNHYHKKTKEHFYVLQGQIRVSFFSLKNKQPKERVFTANDFFTVEPYTLHTIHSLKISKCLVVYSRRFSQKTPDLYKL